MGIKRLLPALALSAALLFPQKADAEGSRLGISLFPEMPVYRSAMADSDVIKTEINLPFGLEQNVLDSSVKELAPYISLGKEIPLVSLDIKSKKRLRIIPSEVAEYTESTAFLEGRKLSDKVLSASLVVGGLLRFPKDENPRYTAKAELFLRFPMVDDYLSDGNKLILVAGAKRNGTIKMRDIEETSIRSLPDAFSIDSYSFFGDIYIVAKSPYSDQFLIVRGGMDNLGGNTSETSNVNLSAVFEFPSIISWIKMFKDFKINPYVSLGIKLPLDSSATKASGELGAKLTGESKKSAMIYVKADYNSLESMKYSTGLKLDL